MPKVSYATKDLYEPKLGFQEGWFEIVAAETKVFQYPPNRETGKSNGEPFLAAVLMFQRTDEQGAALDEEPQERMIRIEKDLNKMRPGMATSSTDDDPDDMGAEIDATGNCIYTQAGASVNTNTGWANFIKSLEERGFKAEILGQSYLPDLVGTKGHAVTVKGEKRSFEGKDVEPNLLVVDKLTYRPYEGKKGKAPAKTTTAAAKANGVPAAPSKAAAAPAKTAPAAAPPPAPSGEDADSSAAVILAEINGDLDGETREAKKVWALAYARLLKDKDRDKKLDKSVQDLWRDEDWLKSTGESVGYQYADGVFAFGGAEISPASA
jgi:hypothetical protein